MEIKILKAIEVAKKEAQFTRQTGGDMASGLKANEPSSNPQQNKQYFAFYLINEKDL